MESNQVMRLLLPWLPCLSLCRDSSSEAQLCQHMHVQAPSWCKSGALDSRTPQKPPLCSGAESWASPRTLPQPQSSQAASSEPPPATPEPRLAQAACTQGPPREPEWCPGSSSGSMGPGPAPAAAQPARGPAQPCPHLPGWCHAPRSAAAHSVPPLGESRSSAALGRAWNTARRRRLDSKAEETPHISREPQRATGGTTSADKLQGTCPLHSPVCFPGAPNPTGLVPCGGSGSSKNLLSVPVGWQHCHIHRALL